MTTELIPTPAPHWLSLADAEEQAELAALGIAADSTEAPSSQPARDALASRLLRAQALVLRERDERQAACAAEIQFVAKRYAHEIQRLDRRAVFLESATEALALESDFGSKKSREVGFGTYGCRKKPAAVIIDDEPTAIAALRESAPDALSLSVTLPLVEVRQKYPRLEDEAIGCKLAIAKHELKAYVLTEGLEVPGVHVEPESQVPFAKPMLPSQL